MSELRKDPITGSWVIIAADRALRPSRFKATVENVLSGEENPFAPGNESMTPPEILRIADTDAPDQWQIRVIPNKYPALNIEGNHHTTRTGLYERMDGVGAHEVIIESPNPAFSLHKLPPIHLVKVLKTYRDRMADLAGDSRFISTILFRNSGAHAGATVAHGHAQLIALPMVPPQITERLNNARLYFEETGKNLFEDIIAQEEKTEERVVCQNEQFVCLTPYASRSPYELMIIPRGQLARYEDCSEQDLEAFGDILAEALDRLEGYLGEFAYNFMIQSAPRPQADAAWYRWHLQIIPRLTQVAGFEWATNFYINPTSPEAAAASLKRLRRP